MICQSECGASTTSSIDDEMASTTDERALTVSSVASHRQTHRPPTSPSSITASSHRHSASPSSLSAHSRCSCSRRVTDIRALSGFYSDGDVDDAVATETRRSLRSTTSEGGAFRRVLPSRPMIYQRSHSHGSVGIASTLRDCDVTHGVKEADGRDETNRRRSEWLDSRATQHTGHDIDHWTTSEHVKTPRHSRRYEASDWFKTGGLGVERQRKRLATSDWVNGVVAEARQAGQRRRRSRQVLSVVKSGAGLRAISETGDTCRLADVSSLAPDVSHPVIRGLYRPAPPVPTSSSVASSSSSSSSSSPVSVTAAARHRDKAASDDSDDHSQQSIT